MAQVTTGFRDGMNPAEAGAADAAAGLKPLKKPKKFLMRRWLNRRGSQTTAFVFAEMECSTDKYEDGGVPVTKKWVSGSLTISDCTRQISLVVQADQNTINKLESLARAVLEARDWVQAAKDWQEEEE